MQQQTAAQIGQAILDWMHEVETWHAGLNAARKAEYDRIARVGERVVDTEEQADGSVHVVALDGTVLGRSNGTPPPGHFSTHWDHTWHHRENVDEKIFNLWYDLHPFPAAPYPWIDTDQLGPGEEEAILSTVGHTRTS